MVFLTSDQFLGFLMASLLITMSPGPDNLMVLSTGASRGRRLGMAFGLGCGLGCLSHTLLAALGISALIAASPWAFGTLRIVGGAYLVYLGVQALRSTGGVKSAQHTEADASVWRVFGKGLFANAINPKVVMFFLAFLPQFVENERGGVPWQIAQLGVIFTVQAALLFGALGFFAGQVGGWLHRNASAGRWLDRIAGAVLVGLGVKLLTGR